MRFQASLLHYVLVWCDLSEPQKETEYLDETYDEDIKQEGSPKETEYLDETYDEDIKSEKQ